MSAFYTSVARFYDADTSDKVDDLALYSRLAADVEGPILDVGCGTGRIVFHLAQEDHRVVGVDNNRAMLDIFERKLEAMPHLRDLIDLHEANITDFQTEERFGLILLSYNALMHFYEQPLQMRLLQHLGQLLREDGLLVIDLPNAGETFATQDSDAMILERKFIDPETGHMIMLWSTSYLDRVTQLLHVQWFYDEVGEDGTVKRLFAPNVLRYYFYPEMRLLLQSCGLEIEAVYGDPDDGPFEDGCERMILYARRQTV